MVLKSADGTEEKLSVIESICPVYREKFVTHCMSFEFAQLARLQYLEKKLDSFWRSMSSGSRRVIEKAF